MAVAGIVVAVAGGGVAGAEVAVGAGGVGGAAVVVGGSWVGGTAVPVAGADVAAGVVAFGAAVGVGVGASPLRHALKKPARSTRQRLSVAR